MDRNHGCAGDTFHTPLDDLSSYYRYLPYTNIPDTIIIIIIVRSRFRRWMAAQSSNIRGLKNFLSKLLRTE